jgi:hypothetical protein
MRRSLAQFSGTGSIKSNPILGGLRCDYVPAAAHRVLAIQTTFTIRGFATTAGFSPAMFNSFAEAWREAPHTEVAGPEFAA